MQEAKNIVRPEVKIGWFYGHLVHELGATGHNDSERVFRDVSPDFQVARRATARRKWGRAAAENTDTFAWDFAGPETVLFYQEE